MTRFAFVVALAALACGGKGKSTDTTTRPGGDSAPDTSRPAVYAKKISLSWGVTPAGEMADIFLQTTDEVGQQVSHPVGRYKGTCEPITPAPEMNAITGVRCTAGGGGTELHAVKRADEIIVVQAGFNPGQNIDPMAREQVKSINIPVGVAVEGAQ